MTTEQHPGTTRAGRTIAERERTLRAERARAARYWDGFQPRIVATFAVVAVVWIGVIVLGTIGAIPLWLGLIANTVVASTFYMPMHEASHGNIAGRDTSKRGLEQTIGSLCAIPLGLSFAAHAPSHMKHHAYTNDPDRDPDHWTHGRLRALPGAWIGLVVVMTLLPVFAFVPPAQRLMPARLRRSLGADTDRASGIAQLRFWLLTHAVLLAAVLTGFGWPAFLLWYLPSKLQTFWLVFIFAWFPHHPADTMGRYADTRVAVFPGSTWLVRGHDHHAVHHMFPRVPHYHLRALWREIAPEMVAKGVRAEGDALGATGPIIW
jgi:beta-carotene hydroxylase